MAVLMQPADQQHSTRYEVRRVRTLRDLIDTVRALRIIAIDIPIGLADASARWPELRSARAEPALSTQEQRLSDADPRYAGRRHVGGCVYHFARQCKHRNGTEQAGIRNPPQDQ
jgi:hypothetical protein